MLEDRDYMREQPGRSQFGPLPPVTAWLVILVLNVVVFLVQNGGGPDWREAVFNYGALSLDGLKHGFIWQFLAFQFLHGGIGHLVFNAIALYSFGRIVEARLGRQTFLSLYLVSGFVGGIAQILLGLIWSRFDGAVVGASAGICGLVAAFALLNPHSTILAFFILPIRAIYFLPLMIAASMLLIIFPTGDPIAHGAHLGGILTGVAWIKFGWHQDFSWLWWKPLKSRQRKRELVRAAFVRSQPWRSVPDESAAELPPEEFISKQVDPILDKISAHGIQSLTERERKVLELARKKMAKR